MKPESTMESISPALLEECFRSGKSVELIDVSSPAEFEEVHVSSARNLPIGSTQLIQFMELRKVDCENRLYVMCRGGVRSVKVCKQYPSANLVNVEGGTKNWLEQGLPAVRNTDTFSVQRQVQIAAGALALTGSLLAAFVHPYFVCVPAIVGSGLLTAGLTNTCGMAMFLVKMPWNQKHKKSTPPTVESFSH